MWHVGKDILVNGKNIYSDITDGMSAYSSKNYNKFGRDIGDALALVLIGKQDIEEQEHASEPTHYLKEVE